MSDSTPRSYAVKNYVSSAVDEFVPPPPYAETQQPQQPIVSNATIGAIAISANVAVTVVIVVAMLFGGARADLAILRGILYFGISTPLFLLIVTGGLVAVINSWQHQTTERRRIDAHETTVMAAIEWRRDIEANRAAELQAQAMPQQLTRRIAALESELLTRQIAVDPLHAPRTFVTAFDNRSGAAFADEVEPAQDSSANEAVAWASQLYNELGQPDPKKIQLTGDPASIGRLRVKMLGSKRGSGSREAGLWLLRQGIAHKVAGGYCLNLKHYPTRESLRGLL